jgi:hypothetical protein
MPQEGGYTSLRRVNCVIRQRFIFCFKQTKQKVYFCLNYLFLHLPEEFERQI